MDELKILYKNIGGVFQGEEEFVPVVRLSAVDQVLAEAVKFAEYTWRDGPVGQDAQAFLASPLVTDWRARQAKEKAAMTWTTNKPTTPG